MDDQDHLPNLIKAVSSERFEKYRRLAASDAAAWELYSANVAYSAAFYAPLQALEVALRNAVDRELSHRHPSWLTGTSILHGPELRQVAEARDRLARQSKPADHGRLIAELSFGFWSGLFANAYDTDLWRTALHRLLYPRQQRPQIHDMLERLRTLRNRIAHHEPIIQRRLMDDQQRIVDLLSWIDPATARWVDERSRVLGLLVLPPAEVATF
jgi:Swt1-like HEPN/Abi-like protein